MTGNDWPEVGLYLVLLLALAAPLGVWMARVYEGKPLLGLERVLGPLERGIYRLIGTDPASEMSWRAYAAATLAFNLLGFLAVYGLQRVQGWLPFNPDGMGAVSPRLAFNTAVSFATNTNWQAYGGETTLSYLTQMLGLTVQNFVSAATGMAALAAMVRGFARRTTETIGSFWADLVRTVLYILLPLSLLLAVTLVSQGVVQDFSPARQVQLVEPLTDAKGVQVTTQVLSQGPAASQVAIKQLGTNGGGFFNVNSAHPYENPTPLSNLLELLAILLIPAALCTTLGRMVGSVRQGMALLAAMLAIWVPLTLATIDFERQGTLLLAAAGVNPLSSDAQAGGNMEGKEVRFGIANSALWATATTAASNGSVNSMHDSFTPLGGLIPLWLMQLGEVIFGGVGSGLYGMLHFAIVAVFIAGLMIGRTPEYLGKKIEPFEMKMATIGTLVPVLAVLIGSAVAVVWPGIEGSLNNRGPHGFSEVLYAFSSASNNNGSAFAGLGADTPLLDTALGLAMLFGRYLPVLTTLAIAGSLARKKVVPAGAGTLKTDGPLFVILLVAAVIVVGALSFIPALAVGPIVEHLRMGGM